MSAGNGLPAHRAANGGGRKTYWHLAGARRLPSSYEVVTSRLLYYVERGGFSVTLPTGEFYQRHQTGSPLQGAPWDELADPRATTYASYVALQSDAERHLARILETLDGGDYDRALPAAWTDTLAGVLSPLRYALHGLQMASAYLGQIAPAGRIAVAASFQAGDDVRRIQGVARRLAYLRTVRPGTGADGRERWQSDPAWQPLRRLVETLLVTYDWGEALIALNVCAKPRLDALILHEAAHAAEEAGDYVDSLLLRSYQPDATWQRAWTERLVQLALARGAASCRPAIEGWLSRWRPLADDAVRGLASLFADRADALAQAAAARADDWLASWMGGSEHAR